MKDRGFTIIELMVVIAIIALIASIIFASLNQSKVKAAESGMTQDIRQVKNSLELYHSDNSTYSAYSGKLSNASVGISPNYISKVPKTNPIISKQPDYFYLSNGKNAEGACPWGFGSCRYKCPPSSGDPSEEPDAFVVYYEYDWNPNPPLSDKRLLISYDNGYYVSYLFWRSGGTWQNGPYYSLVCK